MAHDSQTDHDCYMSFETFQPATIRPNNIVSPCVFNGMCLVRRYQVTVQEIDEPIYVLQERLQELWDNRQSLGIRHGSNRSAMLREAEKLGMELKE